MAEQNGMEKPDLQALPTINDRMTFLYLEHCKIHREDGAITARDLEGTLYIPAAAITVLLLGPGTDISVHSAENNERDTRFEDLMKKSNVKILEDEAVLVDNKFYVVGRLDYEKTGKIGF